MKTIERRILITVLALSSSLGAVGCGANGQSVGSQDTKAYDDAVLALKQAQPVDYDAALAQLRSAYGIQPALEVGAPSPAAKPGAAQGGEALSSAAQALSSGTQVYSLTYNVLRTEYETMRLTAGQRLDWYTTQVTAGTDPVMVLFQYESTNFDCSVSPSAMPKLGIKAFNDDYSGSPQSRFQYTVPSSGCYALLIYAYAPASAGTVRLHKDGCDAPPPPTCSGQNPTICTQGPTTCYVSTVDTGPAVPATGTAVRGVGMDFMATSNSTGGADPWLFAFNFSSGTGAANDDTSGINSAIDRTDFSLNAAYPNAAVLTGYNSVGSSTFKGYRR